MIYFYTLVLFLGRTFRSQARVGETANCGKEEYLKLQISKYEHQQDISSILGVKLNEFLTPSFTRGSLGICILFFSNNSDATIVLDTFSCPYSIKIFSKTNFA